MADSYNRIWYLVGEGEGEGEGGKKDEGTPPAGEEKKFTQKELDNILNKRFSKEKTEKEQLVSQLEKFKETQGLSEAEKTELQSQIDKLNESLRSKEEQAQFEKKELEKKLKTELDTLSKDRDTWKSRYYDSTIKRAITDAAVSAGAEDPSQFVMMFSGVTRLEQEKGEDGKLSENFVPRIKFQGVDSEKKPITLDLTIGEAFVKMKEMGLHKNLFRHGSNSGTGEPTGGKGGGSGSKDPSKMPLPENYATTEDFSRAYQTWRSEYNADGSKRETSKGVV